MLNGTREMFNFFGAQRYQGDVFTEMFNSFHAQYDEIDNISEKCLILSILNMECHRIDIYHLKKFINKNNFNINHK